jgi:hypothetical protein
MSSEISKVSFGQIVKHPVTYMLLVAISLLWFFVYRFTGASNQVSENCEIEKTQLRTELTHERSKNDDLVKALLVKNGIIDDIKTRTDSLVREKIGNEAKQHVK